MNSKEYETVDNPSVNESKKDKHRLFVAVPLPDELKLAIGEWSRKLRAAQPFRKWTETADLHVTLQFLGDTEPERIEALKSALAASAGRIQPFRLTLEGAGVFGRSEQPRVLWAGIGGEPESLRLLQRAVVEATAPLGFQAEARPYSPHLTIARSYAGSASFSLPELLGDGDSAGSDPQPAWRADEIVLYRTHMHRRPMYEAAARFALG
ncbi:RNA 2',3'-cyclic phosphodiesterase [Paenibacillus lycopersici]|uniref:RNA 2',3'-cyclic phosphodiesterase n=1 Tax=Paenibacillus lycopersici TaxID=2704462 RepID=A0A6C0FUK6_9BACL|nr:RNA 2',3'-cyclic phosphodiesterase [Paenibacillus lycopersici]QHT59692.1 RNA 2',3'-cyclic phosphodiesterase [Paenibacillus lycopersici]